jgi:hypothetical protein
MATTEGPEEQPPAAWVWSQYRGEQPADSPSSAETPGDAPAASPAPAAEKNSVLIAIGLAGAALAIAGLTWLFASQPVSAPAESPPPAIEAPAEPQKSDAAPPPAGPAPAAAPAQEAPKPPAPAEERAHGKKKKRHKG